MQKVRNLFFVLALTGVIMACSISSTASIPDNNVATIVASTLQALTPAAPPAGQATAALGIPVTYKNVSFTIPTGLASDAAPQTVPVLTDDNGGPWGAGPEHIEFTLDNYNVPANSFGQYKIVVYPADAYANANAGANISLQRLKGILGNPSAALTNDALPQVPFFNAASMFAAQVQRIHFANGDGLRMVTQYGQAFGPAQNNSIFYHFEGLTSDGKYYIIAILPVQLPYLSNGNDQNAPLPAGGIPFPGYTSMDPKSYDDYFTAVTNKLNSTDAAVFQPALSTLDALVQSFKVTP